MDFQALTFTKLSEDAGCTFDPSDENAYYESATEMPWLVFLALKAASGAVVMMRRKRALRGRLRTFRVRTG